jgi:L-2-hydroxyglutarate oxidase LhgO
MDAEITVIGAGVVGLAVAAELSRHFSPVFVVEKHEKYGMETSSRNSEVIHSGIYYRPGSLKAILCREGRDRLYDYCREKEIPHRRCGKLIVAVREEELGILKDLLATARANDVTDGRLLDAGEANALEPNIRVTGAAFFPSSGIVDVHALMQSLENEAVIQGTEFVYNCEVTGLSVLPGGGFRTEILDADGQTFDFSSRYLVNAAGLFAEQIARMAGISGEEYRTWFWKGEYFALLNGKHKLIDRLIYPVPELNTTGLGIHTTPDMAGRQKLGPNTIFLEDGREDYTVDPSHARDFYEKVKSFLPFLEPGDLTPDQAGIRPKLQRPGEPPRDFLIREESERGAPGLVNLVGIESPGLTAALSIGTYVRKLITKE